LAHEWQEAGKVFVPESVSKLRDYMDELAAFPTGNYDDAVDSTTQALNYFRERRVALPFIFPGSSGVEFDREELWERALRGYALTQVEINGCEGKTFLATVEPTTGSLFLCCLLFSLSGDWKP
jgi:hypothetical protein